MTTPAPSVAADTSRAADPSAISLLIALVAAAAAASFALTAARGWELAAARPSSFLTFVALAACLQLVSVEVYGRGAISFAGTGVLALGFEFGAGAAIGVAALLGVVNMVQRRGRLDRGVFDAAQWALAAAAGCAFYERVGDGHSLPVRFAAALGASALYMLVNLGLLSTAMGLAEGIHPLAVWRERFQWFTPYYLTSGPLALALVLAYERVGVLGLVAFAFPPAFMMLSTRQYIARTRTSVEEVRLTNEELRQANASLAERNDDLRDLFEFAGSLGAQSHDRAALVAYAESALERLTGARVRIVTGLGEAGGELLSAGGEPLGSVHVDRSERWQRLREAILPQLATAVESAALVERIRKTHLETIAALSRSMEAKDYYTGGHTERVASVAVALARRLGFRGGDLDAIEIGALLHDIGKIGIPERVLHKPGPLDDEEWKVMKEHPVISEYILSEVDLHPMVCQIARSSHERIDGTGYPDGLTGEQIPLAARIVLVADALDALTSDRPYRRGRRVREAIEELRGHSGTQFCPQVMEALELLHREEPHVLAGGELRAISAA